MAHLTYDGSARDHEVLPQVLKPGKNGKPQKRKVKVPAQTIFHKVETYNLMGMKFPAGEALSVVDKNAIKKAVSLACFAVEISEGEPITHDKEWLTKALQGERVTMVAKLKDAPPASMPPAEKPAHTSDGLDEMKRTELMRLATTRGLSVNLAMRKDDIVALLREQAAPALAEAAAEGGDIDLDTMSDVG